MLKLRGTEGVASVNLTGRKTALEPRDSLCTRAVGKCLRDDRTARLALERVVADPGGGVQGGFNISGFKTPPALFLRAVRPHTGKTVGLQLDTDAEGVRLCFAAAFTLGICLAENAKQVLNMMSDLMPYDI